MADIDIAKLRELDRAATPGEWQWFGNTKHNEVYLATKDRGRQFVMDFVRWGMRGAQPRFQVLIDGHEKGGGVMRSLSELAQGDENAAGRLPLLGPKFEVSYRRQFVGIGHADAEIIVEARNALPALLDRIELLERLLGEACDIAERRGAAIEYLHRQVDGYDVIKEVANEIEHGIVDTQGRGLIDGAVVQPNTADRIAAIREELSK